jgi:hypothetical protein
MIQAILRFGRQLGEASSVFSTTPVDTLLSAGRCDCYHELKLEYVSDMLRDLSLLMTRQFSR